jgi:hypothetical protein
MNLPSSAALFLAVVASASVGFAAKAKPGPDVLVVGDLASELAEDFVPTPDKPVHYLWLGSGERTLGAVWAGERQPDRATLEKEVMRVLGTQNFQRTQIGGPMPKLAIVVMWGSANLMIDDIEETDDAGETTTSSLVWNRREIAQLVGADKANQKMLSGSEADAINDAARQDRLYLMVAAFDAMALAKKEKKLVWRTRISIESRRTSLPESLTVMLNSAAPYIGRSTELPVFIDDNLRRRADVQIGAPVVVPSAEKDPKSSP